MPCKSKEFITCHLQEKVVEQSEDDDSNQMGPDTTTSKNPVRKSDSTDLEAPPNSVEAVETTTGR